MENSPKLPLIYKGIKIVEALIIIVIGIIICIFSGNETFQNAISYCVATIALVFGLLTIAFAYLFQKGIASVDTISGTFMVSLGVLVIINPEIITNFIPLFFGIILLVYAIIFLIETIVYYLNVRFDKKNLTRAIIYTIVTIILSIGAGLVLAYLDKAYQWINILIGIMLIVIGIALIIYTFVSETNNKRENSNYPLAPNGSSTNSGTKDSGAKVVDVKAIETTTAKKRGRKKLSNPQEIKQIDTKSNSKQQ